MGGQEDHKSRKTLADLGGQAAEIRRGQRGEPQQLEAERNANLSPDAVAMAVEALKHQDVRRIVLVRPAVEAGESLGYLPGDLHAKINPYLRPLFDALQSLIGFDTMKQFMEQDVIEVVPLAYMRGRTLDEAFIILDEAQNTTISQMKMFLTRMGTDSKIVVSGDATQIDLPVNTPSGLIDATRRLAQIQGVASLELTAADIVRHQLVQQIVSAYDTRPEKSTNNRHYRT